MERELRLLKEAGKFDKEMNRREVERAGPDRPRIRWKEFETDLFLRFFLIYQWL